MGSGNLGLGTDAPVAKLNIKSQGTSSSNILVQNSLDQGVLNFFEDTQSNGVLLMGDKDGWDDVTKHPKIRLSTGGQHSYILPGNFGIGTDAPKGPLHVQPTSDRPFTISSTGMVGIGVSQGGANMGSDLSQYHLELASHSLGGPTIGLHNYRNDLTELGKINFVAGQGDGIVTAQIIGSRDVGDGLGSSLRFLTKGANADPVQERMIISPSGNVGIATSAPSRGLHVFGATGTYDESSNTWTRTPVNGDVMIEQTTALNSRLILRDGLNDNEWYIQNYIGGQSRANVMGALTIGNGSGKRQLIVNKLGNVGIGCDDHELLPSAAEGVKGIHIHAPSNPQVRLTSDVAGNLSNSGFIVGTGSTGSGYILNDHAGQDTTMWVTPEIDSTRLVGEFDANASNAETPGTYKVGDIVSITHENGQIDYYTAVQEISTPALAPSSTPFRYIHRDAEFTNSTLWAKHHYFGNLQLLSDGKLALNGAQNSSEGVIKKFNQSGMNPVANVQFNGYGSGPPNRNMGLFLNASNASGHPALMLGHSNSVNFSVKSDPDSDNNFTIRNHNFGINNDGNVTESNPGSEKVFEISRNSHAWHRSYSGSQGAQHLNSIPGQVTARNQSYEFLANFTESTLPSGGLASGFKNPTHTRFTQTYNHVGTESSNGDYLDISIVGSQSVNFAGTPDSYLGHYAGMGISSGYGDLFLTARNIDRDNKELGNTMVKLSREGPFSNVNTGGQTPSIWTYNYHMTSGKSNSVGVWANVDQETDYISNANGRQAYIGVYNNPSNTTLTGLLNLTESNGNAMVYWSHGSKLMTSTSQVAVGGGTGQAVGDQTSDERLKNIKPEFKYGLEQVLKLKPIEFSFKSDDSVDLLGFGAQSTKNIIPEVVYDTNECLDGYETEYAKKETGEVDTTQIEKQSAKSDKTKLAMQYVQLIPVLTKAIQEQNAVIEELKAKVANLESK
jgi:hypothetical protein